VKSDSLILPIFPLKTVLFPGVPMPLHIFEERYRRMINECLAENKSFGVALIKKGKEVGPPAEPFEVGTEAKISRAERLDDGRLNILAIGLRRFKIERLLEPAPYLSAEVSFLEDEDGNREQALLTDQILRLVLLDFIQLTSIFTLVPVYPFDLPQDPTRFSYLAAHLLNLPAKTKQKLLESSTVEERLKTARDLLVAERMRFIKDQVEKAFSEN